MKCSLTGSIIDGILHPIEEELFKESPSEFLDLMKMSISLFMKNLLIKQKITSYNFRINEKATFSEIKKAYLKKRKEFHPDTLIGQLLSEEFIEKAKVKIY